MRRGIVLSVLLLLVCMAPRAASGQPRTPPTLDRVDELARQGLAAEARGVLESWWESQSRRASRTDVQRGLWFRGVLTTDPAQARLDFTRLVVEYPGGAFSDQALLRLAQLAHAEGDSATAVEHVERIAREYPASPVRREAQVWLATAGPVSAPAAPPGAAPAAPAPAEGLGLGDFTIQIGAFSTLERAQALLSRVTGAGFEGRLVTVPGSDLIRVRVGRFDSAEGANQVLWRLRDLDFTAQLAQDAQREAPVIR